MLVIVHKVSHAGLLLCSFTIITEENKIKFLFIKKIEDCLSGVAWNPEIVLNISFTHSHSHCKVFFVGL